MEVVDAELTAPQTLADGLSAATTPQMVADSRSAATRPQTPADGRSAATLLTDRRKLQTNAKDSHSHLTLIG